MYSFGTNYIIRTLTACDVTQDLHFKLPKNGKFEQSISRLVHAEIWQHVNGNLQWENIITSFVFGIIKRKISATFVKFIWVSMQLSN